jgi:hypothetical protein
MSQSVDPALQFSASISLAGAAHEACAAGAAASQTSAAAAAASQALRGPMAARRRADGIQSSMIRSNAPAEPALARGTRARPIICPHEDGLLRPSAPDRKFRSRPALQLLSPPPCP